MSSSNSIKSLCEDLINSSTNEETLYKTLLKMIKYKAIYTVF